MTTTRIIGCFLLFLCPSGCVQPWSATSEDATVQEARAKETIRVKWERRYGDKAGYWYDGQSVVSREGDVVVAVLSNDLETGTSPVNHLSIVTFSAAGDLISEVAVPKPQHDASGHPVRSAVSENIFINILETGEIFLVGNIVEDRPWVMVVDREGRVVLSKSITDAQRRIRVTNMIRVANDQFVVLGDEGLNSLAIKIDTSGRVIWEVSHDRGAADFFVDGVATRDGGILLIENSGRYNLLGMGSSSLIIGHYDVKGRREAEIQIPGRNGSIVEMSDGTVVVVYDRDMGVGQDIWLIALDQDLKEIWSRSLVKVERSMMRPTFRATTLADGGVIIVGGRAGMPYLSKLDSRGSLACVFSPDAMLPSDTYNVVSGPNGAFVISNVMGPEDSGTRVRIFWIVIGS